MSRDKTPSANPAWFAALAASVPGLAHAQTGIERFGTERDRPLATPTYRAPAPDPFATTPQSLPNDPSRAATSQSFLVNDIEVDGNTIYTDEQLADLVAPFVNQRITSNDLLTLRDAITARYIQAGYLNSGAVIPDQDVSDGVVDIQVVEGRLSGVEVRGLDNLRQGYVLSRVEADGILNREDLQKSFERLSNDPNIARINARLGPGARPGEAVLELEVHEADGWLGEVELATARSPSVGGERLAARAVLRNGLGIGDRTAVEVGATEGMVDVAVAFSTPFTPIDTALTIEANGSDANVVEEPLNELDVISQSYSFRASLTQPVMRGNGKSLTLGLGVSYAYAQTELLDQPFSFSPGAVNGETNLTVARATADFVAQSPKQAFAMRSTLSYGLDKLDQAPDSPDYLEENFWSLATQAQYAIAVSDSGQQILARAELQLASHSLFALEQFSFGGMDSVRGYRRNQVLTDNGAVGSLEVRVPLRDFAFWQKGQQTTPPRWVGAVFVDAGYGWNADVLPDPEVKRLTSAGASLSWRPNDRFNASIYAAAQAVDTPDPADKSIQDYGVGFRITTRLW